MSHKFSFAHFVPEMIPDFILEEYPAFVQFMEAWFEWMTERKNALDANRNLMNYNDIDSTLDEFISHFKKELAHSLPEQTLADKRLLLKHMKEFYRARGTEKSFKFLFNILFKSEAEFYYPHVDLLRPSNGKWQENRVLRCREFIGDPFQLNGQTIFGEDSLASARVIEVKRVQLGPYTVYEIKMNISSMRGIFESGEIIHNSDNSIQVKGHYLFNDINWFNRGQNYQVGDIIELHSESKGGYFGKAVVTSIDDTLNPTQGPIDAIEILDYGVGYDDPPVFGTSEVTITSEFGVNADGEIVSRPYTEFPGYFINDDGKLSWIDRLQDGFFYQQYSYVVYVSESIDQYRNIVKDFIHPAGLQFFGGFRSTNLTDNKVKVIPRVNHSSTHVQIRMKDTARRCERQTNSIMRQNLLLRDSSLASLDDVPFNRGVSLLVSDSTGPNHPLRRAANELYFDELDDDTHVKTIIQTSEGFASFRLGASARSLARNRYYMKPTFLIDTTGEMIAPNDTYWDTYSNVPKLHYEGTINSSLEWETAALTGRLTISGNKVYGKDTLFLSELKKANVGKGTIIDFEGHTGRIKEIISDTEATLVEDFDVIIKDKVVYKHFDKGEARKKKLNQMPEPTLLVYAV